MTDHETERQTEFKAEKERILGWLAEYAAGGEDRCDYCLELGIELGFEWVAEAVRKAKADRRNWEAAQEPAKPLGSFAEERARREAAWRAKEEAAAQADHVAEVVARAAKKICSETQPEAEKGAGEQAKGGAEAKPAEPPRTFKTWPIPEAPEAPAGIGLERLTYPRGLLGHATQYVMDTSRLPNRWLSLTAACSALGKACDRHVLGPGDITTLLWLLLVAETGAGKQHAINCILMMLNGMGIRDCYAAGSFGTTQGIESLLEGNLKSEVYDGNPSPLFVVDEIGSMLAKISKGQLGNVTEIPGLLQTLWGWSPEVEWKGELTKSKGEIKRGVMGPALSIFGDSTAKKLMSALSSEHVAAGLVNRFMLFDIGRGAAELVDPQYKFTQMPKWLGEALAEGSKRLKDRGAESGKGFLRIGWESRGLSDAYKAWVKEVRAMPLEDMQLWMRAPENALRLATVEAYWRGAEVVDEQGWTWAKGVATQSMGMLVAGLRQGMREDLTAADLIEGLRAQFQKVNLKEQWVMTAGAIADFGEAKVGKDLRKIWQAVAHLVGSGDIVEIEGEGRVGRPTRRWKWIGRDWSRISPHRAKGE